MAYFTGLLALVGLLSILCYKFALWLSYRSNIRRHGCTAPPQYAHKDPFFGLDHFVNTMNAFKNGHFLDYKTSQFAKYGKTFQTNNFGTILFETIDPEVSKAVHSTHSANFGLQPLRYETAKHLWGNGIVVVDGEEWKRGRALIRASFDVVHVANFQRLRRHTETLFALLPQDGSTVDLMPLFKRLILDTSSEFIFGEAMGALSNSKECEDFMEAFEYAQKGTAIRAMLGRYKFLHRDKRWWETCKQVTDYADMQVDKALEQRSQRSQKTSGGEKEQKKERLKLVDEMAEETQDRLTLRSLVISVFSPAHDGAAVALSNAMFHIARHPSVWRKAREEILPTQHQELTYELLNSYKYVQSIFKETHRLTTIATLNQRQCLKSTILPFGGGPTGSDPLFIPQGAIVELNYRAMCREPGFWGPDAHLFVPERWETVRPVWEYTPFGGGPRSCPGMRLVYTECAYVFVELLRRFVEVENRDTEEEWKEKMRMTFQSRNGCLVGLVPK